MLWEAAVIGQSIPTFLSEALDPSPLESSESFILARLGNAVLSKPSTPGAYVKGTDFDAMSLVFVDCDPGSTSEDPSSPTDFGNELHSACRCKGTLASGSSIHLVP